MNIKACYQPRPIRFLEIIQHDGWTIKLYSISLKSERITPATVELAKQHLSGWLQEATVHNFDTCRVAVLILHEGKEGCFAVIGWWVDENMLQAFTYLAANEHPSAFILYTDKGIVTCVWEMAVLWFERNAWIKHVLMQPGNPEAISNYLTCHLNADE